MDTFEMCKILLLCYRLDSDSFTEGKDMHSIAIFVQRLLAAFLPKALAVPAVDQIESCQFCSGCQRQICTFHDCNVI